MSEFLELVRKVVAQEMARYRGSALGVVSTVFAHTAKNDNNNFEVDVKLKHEDLELRRAPVAVGHIGAAAPPRPGDLVLVEFIDGDLNQPVVTGRFYHAGDQPPLHKDNEVLFEHRVSNKLNQLRFAADGSIFLQRDVTKPEDNSKAQTSIRIDGANGNLEVKVGDGITLTITSNDVLLASSGKAVKIKCGTLTVEGDLAVTDGANTTTISGNKIGGS
jgi:hypothetical protein